MESEGPGELFLGTGVFAVSAGGWDAAGRTAATGRRTGSEGRGGSAPPMTHLYFARRLLPSV